MKPKGKPDAELYTIRREALGLLEAQAELGHIDLYYGDETQISQQGYVPYGWQFDNEDVFIEATKGESLDFM
ncbi:MAG: IS630 family transposase, partial [Bacteroidota bacterium]